MIGMLAIFISGLSLGIAIRPMLEDLGDWFWRNKDD